MFVARPAAAFIASALSSFDLRERLMLGWAGLRGVIPIWLATFPVIAGIDDGQLIFNAIFFVVVTSTLIQGASLEPLARRLGLTSTEPALPEPLIETGIIRKLGGETLVWRVAAGNAAVGQMVKDLGLPREALVNLIVRGGVAIPPRGSTEIEAGDEIHVVVRVEQLREVEALTARWRSGPLGEPEVPVLPPRGAPRCSRSAAGAPRTATRATRRSSRERPSSAGCASAATSSARWSRSPTVATHSPRPTLRSRPPGARRVVRAPDRPRRAQPAGAGLAAGGGGSARSSAGPRPQTGRLSAGR